MRASLLNPRHHFDQYYGRVGGKQQIHERNQEAWSAGIAPGVYEGL
jgi:hypothetical protein